MTYEQLMDHARDITTKAIDLKLRESAQHEATRSGANPDREAVRASYLFIEPMFEPFSRMPDPAAYDPLIAELNVAMSYLNTGASRANQLNEGLGLANPNLDKMTTAGGYLQGWTGDAAMTFKADFVDKFKAIAGNQFTTVSLLKGVLQAHQEMWRRARIDITTIAENTRNALDNAGGCGKNQWAFTFSVLSAVAAVGGVFITLGAAAPVTFPAIGALASVGSAELAATTTASGDSVDTIITSMKRAVDELVRSIQHVETVEIAQKVHDLTSGVHDSRDKLVATRPSLTGMRDKDLTGDAGMGRSD